MSTRQPRGAGHPDCWGKCRTYPGDPSWSEPHIWDELKKTVDGLLICWRPVVIACHHPHFDEEQCNEVRKQWHSPQYLEKSSSAIQTPLFANKSCDPFTEPDAPCAIGNHVAYSVKFAKEHNLCFGCMGKSTGSQALAVWMGHLRLTEWFDDYEGSNYTGPAVKMQAGVPVEQTYEEANARGLVMVSGVCPTVDFSGGYIQGGGHGPFGSLYGLAADQTLYVEVITTTGEFVRASPTENSDLFWAMSGGGGGTYGILWTVTVKAFPDIPIAGGRIGFSKSDKLSDDTCFAFYSNEKFDLPVVFLPNGTSRSIITFLQPFVDKLSSMRIPRKADYETYPNFLPAYKELELWDNRDGGGVEDSAGAFNIAIRPTLKVAGNPDDAVYPALNSSPAIQGKLYKITAYVGLLRELTPGSGPYLNEADPYERNWQQAFHGSHYNKLLSIKDKRDPDQILYGSTAVGGDRWSEKDDGRLCPAQSGVQWFLSEAFGRGRGALASFLPSL
ncbi:FAD-binding domain-containing protein [Pleurotus eryngii]|uniref:FAD-binding domain-containing protein n=1 Tax=Pleurotus eryngii TaxID=5323 RepID=A0A9P5ZK25_PLEER|nr:FAD-binding domain-containing protein [Pleurotus eryngii]